MKAKRPDSSESLPPVPTPRNLDDAHRAAVELCEYLRALIEERDHVVLPPDDVVLEEEPTKSTLDYEPRVPDEMCDWVGTISGVAMEAIADEIMIYRNADATLFSEGIKLTRIPNLDRIRAFLNRPCKVCHGCGQDDTQSVRPNVVCKKCGGDGRLRVTWAHIRKTRDELESSGENVPSDTPGVASPEPSTASDVDLQDGDSE